MKIKITIDGAEVIDITEVSQITGYNLNKLYELLRYNLFPKPVKIKNKNFWKRSEIEAYMKASKPSARRFSLKSSEIEAYMKASKLECGILLYHI